ncbi:ADP-ribosyltransferase [Methanimicrococcus stummii]|nr:ADP-ribosyltransferase [Methanimicrococcus sp. Es2]
MKKTAEKTEKPTDSINVVAERLELLQEYTTFLIPYNNRKDLTNVEKVCIGNYQDVHHWNNQKHDWSFSLPKEWREKAWCYVINSCCRNSELYDLMTNEEKSLIELNIQNLDNAIQKSKADKDFWIYRGVSNIDWLKDSNVGGKYAEDAFGSFTLDFRKAFGYTNPENPILFQLKLKKGMKALYVDQAEAEILRPRRIRYYIKSVKTEKIQLTKFINIETVVYTIEELRM